MHETGKPLLNVLQGQKSEQRPVWLMRQAGRYLPEYRALRAKAGNFLTLCLTPEWAADVTLQPVKRFGMDAAILFADILLIPHALGQKLEFREGEGPVLEKISHDKMIDQLLYDNSKMMPVYETLLRVKSNMPRKTALIGFCGAPWTVACYMIDGNSRAQFIDAKSWVKNHPDWLQKLTDLLIESSVAYLGEQVDSGAEVLQIFDSWAGLLEGKDFLRWIIEPTKKMVKQLKEKYPGIPIIGFPREARQKDYIAYVKETGIDCLGLDTAVDLDFAKHELQTIKPCQGNMDPTLLVSGGDAMLQSLQHIMDTMGPNHVINLGHGVVPETPPDHVAAMIDFVHGYKG